MSQSSSHPRKRRAVLLSIGAVAAVAGGVLLTVTLSGTQGSTAPGADTSTSPTPLETAIPTEPDANAEGGALEPSPAFGSVLPEKMGGQEAIDALGDKLRTVALRNGKTVEELTQLLLRDASAKVSPEGFIVYEDSFKNGE